VIAIAKTNQTILDSADYAEMTLAKIPSSGVIFKLISIEKATGKFGEFRVMIGTQDGQPFELPVSSKRMMALLDTDGSILIGKLIKIVPRGSGMDKAYRVELAE